MNKIKSFINLNNNCDEEDNLSLSSGSDEMVKSLIIEKDEEKFKEENKFLEMLDEIRYKTNEILNNNITEEELKLSQEDLEKIKKIHKEEIKAVKNKFSKKFRMYYYSLIGLNILLVSLGFLYTYRNKTTNEKIRNEIDNSTFKATRLTNDSWLFKSQPKLKFK